MGESERVIKGSYVVSMSAYTDRSGTGNAARLGMGFMTDEKEESEVVNFNGCTRPHADDERIAKLEALYSAVKFWRANFWSWSFRPVLAALRALDEKLTEDVNGD